jgi:hypothetical protein
MAININSLKRQLNIELTYTDDDAILQHLLDVTETSVENYCGYNALTGYTSLPLPVIQATIMLAAHFYQNRNMVSFSQGYSIPFSFRFLLDPYKIWTIV